MMASMAYESMLIEWEGGRPKSLGAFALGFVLLAACGDSEPTAPVADDEVTVMTRNLYIGTEVASLLSVSSLLELPTKVAAAWTNVQATDFLERAAALADEIAARNPHLVGLQEVSLFRIQSPSDFLTVNETSATEVALDFLDALLDELDARGLSYRAVATSIDIDLEAPMRVAGGLLDDLRLTDRDVILARTGVAISSVRTGNFTTNLNLSPGGGLPTVTLPRGWASVNVTIGDRTFRFVSTHLEVPEFDPDVQVAQANELLQELSGEQLPIIFVGDFNSAADGSSTPTYGNLIDDGYTDVWTQGVGLTCCQNSDLRNPTSLLEKRIDLILFRGDFEVLSAAVVGAAPGDRTPSGLWPSDHAGVAATLRLP